MYAAHMRPHGKRLHQMLRPTKRICIERADIIISGDDDDKELKSFVHNISVCDADECCIGRRRKVHIDALNNKISV